MITCPECDASIDVEEDELDEGDKLMCEDCGLHLIVTGTDPLELEYDEEEEEEFEDDEDEDEDEEFEENEEESEEEEENWR